MEIYIKFWLAIPKGGDRLEDLGVNGRIILWQFAQSKNCGARETDIASEQLETTFISRQRPGNKHWNNIHC
jgi:hypothetical protein